MILNSVRLSSKTISWNIIKRTTLKSYTQQNEDSQKNDTQQNGGTQQNDNKQKDTYQKDTHQNDTKPVITVIACYDCNTWLKNNRIKTLRSAKWHSVECRGWLMSWRLPIILHQLKCLNVKALKNLLRRRKSKTRECFSVLKSSLRILFFRKSVFCRLVKLDKTKTNLLKYLTVSDTDWHFNH